MTDCPTTSILTDALRTVAVNGAYDASRALSKWLRRGVRLTSDGFRSLPIAEAAASAGEAEQVIAAIHLPLAGDVSGHMLLTFPEEVACFLVDLVMQQPEGTTTELGEVEQSCLQETGNIVCSAYANSLSRWLKLHIEPAAPVFMYDMACSVVTPLLSEFAVCRDEVLVATTDFMLDSKRLEWGLMLLPSESSLIVMEERCHKESIRDKALHTIAINGAFQASRAMSKWLKRGVKISTDGFVRIGLADVAKSFGEDMELAALHLPLGEQMHGHALLAIERTAALRLVDLLMGQPAGTSTEFGEIEQSALEETGNIISSSYVNSWSQWLDINIEPAAPQFVLDLPGAVLDSVLAEQARFSDEVFLAKTNFLVDDQWLEWVFLLLPAPSAMRMIETSCDL